MFLAIVQWIEQRPSKPSIQVRFLVAGPSGVNMAGYTKEFLVDAFMSRFVSCSLISIEKLVELEEMANRFYDEVGRDKFRTYASLDADAIKTYKANL